LNPLYKHISYFIFTLFILAAPLRVSSQVHITDTSAVSAGEVSNIIQLPNPVQDNSLKLYKPIEKLSDNSYSFFKTDRRLGLLHYTLNLDSGKTDSNRLKTDTGTGKTLTTEQKEYQGWESKHHLLVSLIEVALIEYIPFALAKYTRDWGSTEEINWTKVTWESWKKNIRDGFEYDGDNFLTNYFAHPYHGSAYFNAGRTNGYDFWQSSIYAFIGSGVWETFAESFRPSFNDLVNTTVNGVNFGETLFRLSAMVTDNRASGFERVWRETVGGLINPVRGINRLITGDAFKKFDNPYYGKQPLFLVKLSAGMRRLDNSGDSSGDFFSKGEEQGIYSIDVQYGDLFSTIAPFSYFNLGAELTSGLPHFAQLYSSGHIYGITINNSKDIKQKINFTLNYSYTNKPGVQYGETSIIPNFLTRVKVGKVDLLAQVGLNGILLGGTNTDYFIAQDGRDYDMGPGLGAIGNIEIIYKNWTYFKLYFTNGWIFSMTEPQESTHNLNHIQLSLALPFNEYFAIGLDASMFWRKSYYEGSPDVKRQVPVAKLYFSTYL
jgi:hypothetical protein